MSRCQKADTISVSLVLVGTKRYCADLFRDFHEKSVGRDGETTPQHYECETVRTSTGFYFEDEIEAMQFFTDNFDALFEQELHNEELDARTKEVAEARDFLNSTDYQWFKALEQCNTISQARTHITSRFPTFFEDRQRARDIINGIR